MILNKFGYKDDPYKEFRHIYSSDLTSNLPT